MTMADYVKKSGLSIGEVADLRAKLQSAEALLRSRDEEIGKLADALESEASALNRKLYADEEMEDAEFHGGRVNAKAEVAKRLRALSAALAGVDSAPTTPEAQEPESQP